MFPYPIGCLTPRHLCLLQKNLRSNGFSSATTQRSGGNTGLPGKGIAYVSSIAIFGN